MGGDGEIRDAYLSFDIFDLSKKGDDKEGARRFEGVGYG